MAELPLLFFHKRGSGDRDAASGGGGDKTRFPSVKRQAVRIRPKLQRLYDAFEKERASLALKADSLDPEYVLVLETRGSIDTFLTVVRYTEGLEWLGDINIDDLEPDLDFYRTDDSQKQLKGRLFLSMANHRAIGELVTLFEQYVRDPEADLGYGRNSWKNIFALLYDVRQWDETDRLEESGLFEDWKFRLEYEQQLIPVEIELWYRKDAEKRIISEKHVSDLVGELGGQVLRSCQISGASYHAILAHLPNTAAEKIIADCNTKLLQAHQIMFFRPVGQCAARLPEDSEGSLGLDEFTSGALPSLDSEDSLVALLDGVPMGNHAALKQRIIIDDPDDFSSSYSALEQYHGTAMASLIIHDELDAKFPPLNSPLYVRPVMRPDSNDLSPVRREHIPEGELPVDLIHRAVVRMYEGDDSMPPVAPNVKIINLSIGDSSRPFLRNLSPLARLIDYLSWKYKVLFCVSAGNYADPVPIDSKCLSGAEEEKTIEAFRSITQELRHKRILSPAESINALTVGAAHCDKSAFAANERLVDLVCSPMLPSLISAKGLGFRQSIKPDILYRGGRQLYLKPIISGQPMKLVSSTNAPGQRVASPSKSGIVNDTSYICGTSNATALTSRYAAYCCEVLEKMADKNPDFSLESECVAPLLKAMLAHTATWSNAGFLLQQCYKESLDKRAIKSLNYKHMGYGFPSFSKVLSCTEKRATIVTAGMLEAEKSHIYKFPLPPALSGVAVLKQLTATLAWLTPCNTTNQKYRGASLYFSPPQKEFEVYRVDTDWQAVKRGTLQHERLEGSKAAAFLDGDFAEIKVNCREDAGFIETSIPYGLVVTLEVDSDNDIVIYEEIKERLRAKVPVRPRQ